MTDSPMVVQAKTNPWYVVLGIVLALLMATNLVLGRTAGQQSWEYAGFFASGANLKSTFNEAGSKGWEVVHCRWARSDGDWGYECLFKRPKW